jgi:hypothetical protein
MGTRVIAVCDRCQAERVFTDEDLRKCKDSFGTSVPDPTSFEDWDILDIGEHRLEVCPKCIKEFTLWIAKGHPSNRERKDKDDSAPF